MADHPESPSSGGGLSHLLSKTRSLGRKSGNSSQISIERVSSSASSEHSAIRESIESAYDKLNGHSHDDGTGEHNGLKKLMSRSLTSRRRQKREEELRISQEVARGRSVAERGTLENDDDRVLKGTGDDSSVYTDDSDTEEPLDLRPPFSNYSPHSELCTTSLPLIQISSLPPGGSETQLEARPRASTSVDTVATSDSTPGSNSGTLRAPIDGSHKRSPSPVGRLKEALKNRRNTSPHTSPERASSSGAGSLPREKSGVQSRRGSVASKFGSIFPEKQPGHPVTSSVTSSPERPRTGKVQKIDTTTAPPQTPPSEDPAPIIVNTPPTPTEPGVSRFTPLREIELPKSITKNPDVVISPSGNMISHRRTRSSSATLVPSKLSNITPAPLSPTPENSALPTPSQPGGFFSNVISAAQNAANTFSNSIVNTSSGSGGKGKGSKEEIKKVETLEVETVGEKGDLSGQTEQTEQKEPAVKTLGLGDLSLSQLGISEFNTNNSTAMAAKSSDDVREKSGLDYDSSHTGSQTTIGYSIENNSTPTIDEVQSLTGPRSVHEPSTGGDQTPPNGSVYDPKPNNIHRAGSIRSAIGKRRTRGSSAATTIGAAIAAANASVAHPAITSTPKITGFAVASKKRNRDFHQLFRSVPDDDYLIEDYSCALQREILAHGRLYVSEGHLCFSSNILGWVTTLVMSFDEIVSVEKRSTALVFKNGLMISTLHAKNIFASFTSRDSTYDLIVGIWKLGHPSLHSSLNGVRLDGAGGGDKTEKDDVVANGSQSGSDSEGESDDEEVYDEDEEDDGMSATQGDGSITGSDEMGKAVSRKPSAVAVVNGGSPEKKKEVSLGGAAEDFPGPATHAPTDCSDRDTHYDKILSDEIIPAPLGKVYNLMFGPASGTFMRQWLAGDQKCTEVTLEEKQILTAESKVRTYSYIKPLYAAIGPKSTKCVCTETLDSIDLEKAVSVTISTQTPDVPSGNVFSTKTKYCLSWAEGNGTRLQMNCTIEWTGKSWLKGPIEKGANDGQVQFAKDIIAAIKTAVLYRRGLSITPGATKGKKKGRKGRELKTLPEPLNAAVENKPTASNWGVLQPLKPILGPAVDIVSPLLTANVIYAILVTLLLTSWLRFGSSGKSELRGVEYHLGTPERFAAYEELWRREESELWDWLDQRIGVERLRDVGKMPVEAKVMGDKLREEKMDAREVDDAIRVTEERLRLLKEVVNKQRRGEEEPNAHVGSLK
ncbi:hypothetical protein B7463_g1880, partial [Scytalidium lignicola]